MSQLINFENYKVPKSYKEKATLTLSSDDPEKSMSSPVEVGDKLKANLDVLAKNNPDKILFSLKEAANLLRVGEEFIRRRIKSGKIKAIYLGDKPFINIVELARISIEGV